MKGLLVIGASYAGVQAAVAARDAGYQEPIAIVGNEDSLPYQRPPLSKAFLLEKMRPGSLVLRDRAYFESKGIQLILGENVDRVSRHERAAILASGTQLHFDKLLIGTGSRARRLTVPGADSDRIFYLRSLADANALKATLATTSEIVVIGGGFIGLEVAASAAKFGKKVSLIESASRLLARSVSPIVSDFLLALHRRHGVDVRLGRNVTSIDKSSPNTSTVRLDDGDDIETDIIVVGIGGMANDELAQSIGLSCSDGIIVDDHGGSSDANVFAAGDCTRHLNKFAGDWTRLESVQHAQDQGGAAGAAIAGAPIPYRAVPRFWSDQYDAKLQTVGIGLGYTQIAIRGFIEDDKFSVFYFRNERLAAVDSVNRPGDQLAAKRMLSEATPITPQEAADLAVDFKSLLAS